MTALIYNGDCRVIMEEMLQKNHQYDFIFADPPFNIGENYNSYDDHMVSEDYENLILDSIHGMCELLSPDGVLCLYGSDELVELYLPMARINKLKRISWIIWHYKFGQCNSHNWINSHSHILIYTKQNAKYTWNPDTVKIPSDRATKYYDPRIFDSEAGGERLPLTVWSVANDGSGFGRVTGNSKERRPKHPNQIPEKIIERLILAYTKPGDSVLDPFGGSGTTITVAERLGRLGSTIELDSEYCRSIQERLSISTKSFAYVPDDLGESTLYYAHRSADHRECERCRDKPPTFNDGIQKYMVCPVCESKPFFAEYAGLGLSDFEIRHSRLQKG